MKSGMRSIGLMAYAAIASASSRTTGGIRVSRHKINRQRIMLNAFCRSSQPAKDHGRHLTTSCAIGA